MPACSGVCVLACVGERDAVRPAVLKAGLAWGLLGVAAFSFTVPFTRVAVGGLSPSFIGSGRAVVAAVLAAAALSLAPRQHLPHGQQWARLAVVGGGVVVGFPLLTSFALTTAPASHGAVVIGRYRPPRRRWPSSVDMNAHR